MRPYGEPVPRPSRDQSAGIRHVTCRGNRRQPIFLDDLDRRRYLWLLEEVCSRYAWRTAAYCLMTNHVHLVVAVGAGTISSGMQWLSGKYGQLFNRRHQQTGHLFQGRFGAEIVGDGRHILDAARYADLNPVRAGLVDAPTRWCWSGHRALVGLDEPLPFHDISLTLDAMSSERARAHAAYAKFVAEQLSPRNRGQTPG
jgi:REP-associated tyrosine transposase